MPDARSRYTIAWHDGPRGVLRDLFELADDSPQQLEAYIDEGRVLVALDERGELVGHLQLIPMDAAGVVEIKSLAVRASEQRRGIGRRLVEHALDVCRGEQICTVTVTTATADIGNLRFYQRCGLRATAVEPDAFTPAQGYPPDLAADGIPVRDGIRFTIVLS